MITKNEMQLKPKIKSKALETGITPQAALQIYCLERLLDRISQSGKKDCFIIKGGFLISSMIGSEIKYSYNCIFDKKTISVFAYPLENILAEKLETVVSRGKANTRPRDYYDIHILYSLKKNEIDHSTLKKALESTATKRGSLSVIKDYAKILDSIRKDEVQKEYWKKYISKNNFAKGITFEQVMDSVENLFNDFSLS